MKTQTDMNCNPIQILPVELEKDQLKQQLSHAHWEVAYYKALHERNVAIRERILREKEAAILLLKQQYEEEKKGLLYRIEELQVKLKLRERQLFGDKSEKGTSKTESQKVSHQKKRRGQQRGKKSPKKRNYTHLPITEISQEIPVGVCKCPHCHTPYIDIESTENSDTIEIDVKAYIRRIKRKKYKRTCSCNSLPIIITAPSVPKVLPKSIFGNTVWIDFLLKKFWHGLPLYRIIQEQSSHGLDISPGTIVGGFSRLQLLLKPLFEKIQEKSLSDKHWNADETGWKVFETVDSKANYRWFLWIFKSASTAMYIVDPSRAKSVIDGYFGNESEGIISCDRYAAYFCFVSQSSGRFSIAFCWAHVRRDFLNLAKDRKEHEAWAMKWVESIRMLYYLNNCRAEHLQDHQKFLEYDKELKLAVMVFKITVDEQLKDTSLAEPCRKVLASLDKHWHGLVTFVECPEVPMDNNRAERGLRGSVVGRKNYYGSGSVDSAQFTAMMFTIIQTLLLWGINPRTWFTKYFEHLAIDPKRAIEAWLPWNMQEKELYAVALQPHHGPP